MVLSAPRVGFICTPSWINQHPKLDLTASQVGFINTQSWMYQHLKLDLPAAMLDFSPTKLDLSFFLHNFIIFVLLPTCPHSNQLICVCRSKKVLILCWWPLNREVVVLIFIASKKRHIITMNIEFNIPFLLVTAVLLY